MMRTGLSALLSHWRRNPWQLLTLVLGLAMATALWSGVQAINAEARSSYDNAADTLTQGQSGTITAANGGPLRQDQYIALRRAGWQVSPILEGRLPTDGDSVLLLGIEPLTLPPGALITPSEDANTFQDFLSDDGVLIAHPDDAASLENAGPRILIDDRQTPGRVFADIGLVQRLLDQPGVITRLLVLESQPVGLPELAAIDPNLRLVSASGSNDLSRLTDSFHLNLTAFGLLAFAVGIFIVYGAIGLAFEQRRPVFRTLRALGMPLRSLMILLAAELTIFALVAGALGVALGYVIAALLLPDVAATLRGLYGAEVTGQLTLRPSWWLSSLAMALAGTAAAALGTFWRLKHLPLFASSQPRAWAQASTRSTRALAAISGLLIATAALVTIFGSGLVAGFILLACLLIGAALALPLVLDLALRSAAFLSRQAIPQWFWADTRQQLSGLSMALMALLLAMAANIGVSTMVSSFRLTFVDFLDQRLASELYLRAETPEQAQTYLEYLAPKVDAILPIISIQTRIGSLPAEVFGVIDHATYKENWQMLSAAPDVWDRVTQGNGVLVNEQLSRRLDLQVGRNITFDGYSNEIVGIFGDYGNPGGQVMLGMDLFQNRYPDAVALRFGLRTGDPGNIAKDMRNRFEMPEEGLVDQAGIKAFSLGVFERTFAVTAALNLLTLSVAGLAILISLLTLATMRLPQLAPVWALGLTRKDLAKLEMIRALCLAAFTGLAALPLGLALAWVLLAVVNVEAFGWRLPMYLFPLDYLKLGVLTLLAAALAATWPAIRLAKTPPGELLKVFSNER